MADVRAAPRYSIVPGDPVEHRDEVLALGYRNLPPAVQGAREARYSKYFEDSPLGPPHFFLARDAQSDSFVGMSAIFPTQLRVGGELVPAAVAGEFAVDDGHRLEDAVPAIEPVVADGDRGFVGCSDQAVDGGQLFEWHGPRLSEPGRRRRFRNRGQPRSITVARPWPTPTQSEAIP